MSAETKKPKGPMGEPPPWLPPPWEVSDAAALQALVRGDATAEQQKRAINWVIFKAADVDGFTYRQNDRDHAFGDGRRFVGQQCKKLISLNLSTFTKKEPEHG
jgi:hypothetical protein